ncbi:MAG TPA: UrcA family protein [Steroidobacteraceae bacterium]|nr:UrcA family protein [Steroidobacteraceae bacterium]
MSRTNSLLASRAGAAVAAVASVALTAVCIANGVTSESRSPPPSVKVAYAGLDLSQPVGAQLLYRRLQQAAQGVCGRLDPVDTAAYLRWQHCYDGALQRAVLQVNAPELLALYRSDAGHARSAG